MASSQLTNSVAVAGIATSAAAAKAIRLNVNRNLTPNGPLLCPRVRKLNVFATASGAIATATGWLYWDAACDRLASGPFTLDVVAALTTASTYNLNKTLDVFLGPASTNRVAADAGCIYLVLAVNANTIDVGANGVELTTSDESTSQG